MRPIYRTAFDVAAGEGVLLHAHRKLAASYSAAYVLAIDAYREQSALEQEAWITLGLLAQQGGPVSNDMLAILFDAWVRARERGDWSGLIARQGSQVIGELDIGYATVDGNIADALGDIRRYNRTRAICKPLIVDGKAFRLSS